MGECQTCDAVHVVCVTPPPKRLKNRLANTRRTSSLQLVDATAASLRAVDATTAGPACALDFNGLFTPSTCTAEQARSSSTKGGAMSWQCTHGDAIRCGAPKGGAAGALNGRHSARDGEEFEYRRLSSVWRKGIHDCETPRDATARCWQPMLDPLCTCLDL